MQINVLCKEDVRAIAEKNTACNYEPEETTQKSKRIAWVIFFPGEVMKNKNNFQS